MHRDDKGKPALASASAGGPQGPCTAASTHGRPPTEGPDRESAPAPLEGARAARTACIIPRSGGDVICGELVEPPGEHDDDE